LGAGGERGVEHVISMLDAGVRRTMALTGQRRVTELGPELIHWRDAPVQ
jgi:isopentenyl diphosphate isomerase/L-lactate dehydrogenase-like FMN-dependent dehydrogenase